jgi:hypothetical protein
MNLKKIKNDIIEKNSIIIDDKIVLEIILTKKSKNKFSGYKTTIFSDSGLKVKVPRLKKVLCIISKIKLKLKLDKIKNITASNNVNKDPITRMINNFFVIFLKLKFAQKSKIFGVLGIFDSQDNNNINKINNDRNKIIEILNIVKIVWIKFFTSNKCIFSLSLKNSFLISSLFFSFFK